MNAQSWSLEKGKSETGLLFRPQFSSVSPSAPPLRPFTRCSDCGFLDNWQDCSLDGRLCRTVCQPGGIFAFSSITRHFPNLLKAKKHESYTGLLSSVCSQMFPTDVLKWREEFFLSITPACLTNGEDLSNARAHQRPASIVSQTLNCIINSNS